MPVPAKIGDESVVVVFFTAVDVELAPAVELVELADTDPVFDVALVDAAPEVDPDVDGAVVGIVVTGVGLTISVGVVTGAEVAPELFAIAVAVP